MRYSALFIENETVRLCAQKCLSYRHENRLSAQNIVDQVQLAIDLEIDIKELIHLFRKYKYGIEVRQDDKKAFYYCKIAAEKHDVEAVYHLCERYYTGSGVAQDERKAIELFNFSALKSFASAQCQLGYCYI